MADFPFDLYSGASHEKQKAPLRVRQDKTANRNGPVPANKKTHPKSDVHKYEIYPALSIPQAIHMTSDKYKRSYKSPPLAELSVLYHIFRRVSIPFGNFFCSGAGIIPL